MHVVQLYHGTLSLFDNVDVTKGERFKDFGQGFYTTRNRQHAENLAKRDRNDLLDKQRKTGKKFPVQAYLYQFDFDIDLFEFFTTKIFKHPEDDLEWINFVLKSRSCDSKWHPYDIVSGATADDGIKLSLKAYNLGVYGVVGSEKALLGLLNALEIHNLPKQIYFGTQRATDTLVFKCRSVVI